RGGDQQWEARAHRVIERRPGRIRRPARLQHIGEEPAVGLLPVLVEYVEVPVFGQRARAQEVARLIPRIDRAVEGAKPQSPCIYGEKQQPYQGGAPGHAQYSLQGAIRTQPKRMGGRGREGARMKPTRRPREAVLKPRHIVISSLLAALAICAPANAGVIHIVQPGETLWSIASSNNFTTRSLAAANGMSENANIVIGSKLTTPTVGEAATALQNGGGPGPLGSYVVRPGDTLSAIAGRSGVAMKAVAFMNGIDPDKPLL